MKVVGFVKEHVLTRRVATAVLTCLLCLLFAIPAFAQGINLDVGADATVTGKMSSLLSIVYAAISAIGTLVTLWGLCEWGLAWNSQDPSGQSQAWKRIVGGMIILLAPQLIKLLV